MRCLPGEHGLEISGHRKRSSARSRKYCVQAPTALTPFYQTLVTERFHRLRAIRIAIKSGGSSSAGH
jgi:hypothetical protein